MTLRDPHSVRIVIIANLYPSPPNPSFGTFIAGRVDALRAAGADVEVLAIQDANVHHRIAIKYIKLAVGAVKLGIVRAATRKPVDIVEAHIAFPTGWIAWPVAAFFRAPLVLFVHGADVAEVSQRSVFHRLASVVLFRRAAIVVANSEYMGSKTRSAMGIETARLVVESPGINFDLFNRGVAPSRSGGGLLFVGRLTREKGVDELLAAHALLLRRGIWVRLTIIGTGPDESRIREITGRAGGAIVFRGPLPPESVAAQMRECAVLVVPSTYQEPLGLVAIEGMAAGAIVVASAIGGLVETVVPGVTGFLCTPGDAVDLAAGIERALAVANDYTALSEMQAHGTAMARRHDVAAIAIASIERYRSVLSNRARER